MLNYWLRCVTDAVTDATAPCSLHSIFDVCSFIKLLRFLMFYLNFMEIVT